MVLALAPCEAWSKHSPHGPVLPASPVPGPVQVAGHFPALARPPALPVPLSWTHVAKVPVTGTPSLPFTTPLILEGLLILDESCPCPLLGCFSLFRECSW